MGESCHVTMIFCEMLLIPVTAVLATGDLSVQGSPDPQTPSRASGLCGSCRSLAPFGGVEVGGGWERWAWPDGQVGRWAGIRVQTSEAGGSCRSGGGQWPVGRGRGGDRGRGPTQRRVPSLAFFLELLCSSIIRLISSWHPFGLVILRHLSTSLDWVQ